MSLQNSWIYFFISGFGMGVLMRSFFDLGIVFSTLLLLLAFVSVFYFWIYRNTMHFFIGLMLFGVVLGIIRFDFADQRQGDPYLDSNVGEQVTLRGVIIDEPDQRETTTKLLVRIERVNDTSVQEKILITHERYPLYTYGDYIQIHGVLEKPTAFTTSEGRIFDYAAYLGKDNIYYTMFSSEVEHLAERRGNPIKQFLFDTKRLFLSALGRVISEPEASLLGGLVVGAKQSLGEELLDDFERTGIVHIVVLSGYNVTIVAEFVMRILSFLPLIVGWVVGILSIVLFAIMTGAGPTIVRASIMAIFVVIARATGRVYEISRALLIAGFFMVLHNPKILALDTSFQLSFLATVGLIHLAPKLESYFGWMPTRWQLREFATATIATQLFVLPLLLYRVGELSLVSLPVNLLILPTVPITMLLGALTGFIGIGTTMLSIPFAFITNALLSYQLFIVDVFARLPFASVSVATFPLWGVLFLYGLYGIFLMAVYRRVTP